jgi:putative ABC transport system permease protein
VKWHAVWQALFKFNGMWSSFFKTAFRNLARYRSYTWVNILGLAFALSVFISLILYIQFEFSYDQFNREARNLYRVEQIMMGGGRTERMNGTPEPLWQVMEDDFPEVRSAIRYIPGQQQFRDRDGNGFTLDIIYVEETFLEAFSFPLLRGNPVEALREPRTIVLTRTTAGRLFGNEDPFGKTYRINNVDYRVTGIVEDTPGNSHIQFDALIPVATLGDGLFTSWGNNWVHLYVWMGEGHDIEKFNEQIRFLLKKYRGEACEDELNCLNILKIHLHSNLAVEYAVTGSIRNIYILMAIAVFILLMAGVNFTNLSVAYSSLRIKEVGIRKIAGGTRRILISQFMSEYGLMTLMAILLGFVLFETFLPVFNRLVSRELDFHYLDNYPLFLAILVVGGLIGTLSGLYPALLLSGYQPVRILRMQLAGGRKGPGLREVLVVIQFTISAALIIGTLGVLRQANYMMNKDLGYNPRNVIRAPVRDTTDVRMKRLREILLENPAIVQVSVHDYPVCQSDNWTGITWEGAEEEEYIRMNVNYADQHFLDLYQMRLLEGRGFTPDRLGSEQGGREVILNREAVKQMGLQDPVSKHIRYGLDYRISEPGEVKIVGVVDDYHFLSVHNPIMPLMIRQYDEGMPGRSMSIRINASETKKSLAYIQAKFMEIFPELPWDYHFVYDFHARMYREEQKMAKVIMALAVIAIVIACLGVYGLIAFTTSRRTREVGIRKAMGASFSVISFQFIREFLVLILIANAIAWPAGYFAVNSWLRSFPYKASFSVSPYLAALLLTTIITVLSMLYHTYKASSLQPAKSLRYE